MVDTLQSKIEIEHGGLELGFHAGNALPDPGVLEAGFVPRPANIEHDVRAHAEHIDQLNRMLQGQGEL